MKEEIYEGYDFLVMLIEAYEKNPNGITAGVLSNDLNVLEMGLKMGWLIHKKGQTDIMFPKFTWTEKAKKYITHLDEWE